MNRLNYLNYFISLPFELRSLIKSFLIGKCDKCLQYYDEFILFKKCVVFKYYNIFDDRYFFPREMEEYNLLCKYCKNQYRIVNSENENDNDTIYLMDYSAGD